MALKLAVISLFLFTLLSCGSSEEKPTEPAKDLSPTSLEPLVTLTSESISLDENSTVTILHSATDASGSVIQSVLTCELGLLEGDEYTAPSVVVETNDTCTATATDSENRSSSETITLTINPVTPVLTLANEAAVATSAKLTAIDVSFATLIVGVIDAKLNGEAIKIAATPDNQLVYFPPMGSTGLQTLELTIEGETVTFEYQSQPSNASFESSEIFLTEFFTGIRARIEAHILAKQEGVFSSEEIEALTKYKDLFTLEHEAYANLTDNELEYLAQIIFENNEIFNSESSTAHAQSYSYSTHNISNYQTLSQCETEAKKTVISVATTVGLISATSALLSSGAGTPWGVVSAAALTASAVIWADSVKRTLHHCFEPYLTAISK